MADILLAAKNEWNNMEDKNKACMIGFTLAANMLREDFFNIDCYSVKYPFLQLELWNNEDFQYQDYLRQLSFYLVYATKWPLVQVQDLDKHREDCLIEALYKDEDLTFMEFAKDFCLEEGDLKSKTQLKEEYRNQKRRLAINAYFEEEADWDETLMGVRPRYCPLNKKIKN